LHVVSEACKLLRRFRKDVQVDMIPQRSFRDREEKGVDVLHLGVTRRWWKMFSPIPMGSGQTLSEQIFTNVYGGSAKGITSSFFQVQLAHFISQLRKKEESL
jgi:hypothetical protein